MAERTSIPRLHRVRFKGGADLRVMSGRQHSDAAYALDIARRLVSAHVADDPGDIAGFAFVVWSHDGASTCKMHVEDGKPFPSILAPDFVRNRLLADRIETWTLETAFPPPPKRGA